MTYRDSVISWIDDVASRPWPGPPHGYPRLDESKVGRFMRRAARKKVADTSAPQQPQEWPVRFYNQPWSGRISPVEFAGFLVMLLVAMLISGAVASALFSLLVFFVGVGAGLWILEHGVHRPVVKVVASAAGLDAETDAITYVPWVEQLRGRPEGTWGVPEGAVSPDCAIVLVAERIAAELDTQQQSLEALDDAWVAAGGVDTGRNLSEIAWGVADYMAHRAAAERADASTARDWQAVIDDEREAIIDRVVAMYSRSQEIGAFLSERGKRSAIADIWIADSAELPDLSASFGAAYLHRDAAAEIDGRRPPQPPDRQHEGSVQSLEDDLKMISMLRGARFSDQVILPSGATVSGDEMTTYTGGDQAANAAADPCRGPGPDLEPGLRWASVEEYIAWLRGYVARGGVVTHRYNYPFAQFRLLYATADVVIDSHAEYGARSRAIVVPKGISVTRSATAPDVPFRGWAHSTVYYMHGYAVGGAQVIVPTYSEPEFAEFDDAG